MAKPRIENEYSFREALKAGINLFLGAGFSTLAKDEEGRQVPAGGGFGLRDKGCLS